jgi:hyaluronan synthase
LRSDERNGCATGFLTIYNRDDGLLPKMIHARYSYAFAVERAASSYTGCMTCCSGPVSIYRLDALDELVLRRFATQRFLTQPCEPGDDRHLTNLVMAAGLKSRQTSVARAGTEAPETWNRFVSQQLRWSRSFYREMYWQLKALEQQSCYLGVITAYETIFPFVIASWIVRLLYFSASASILWRMSAVAVGVLLLRTLVLLVYCRDARVLYNILYYPVYVVVLLPLKFYALLTVVDSRWVTASRKEGLRATYGFPGHLVFVFLWDLVLFGGIAYRVYRLCF